MRRFVGTTVLAVALLMFSGLPAGAASSAQLKAKALSISNFPTGWSVVSSPPTPGVTCVSPIFRGSGLTTAKVSFAVGGNVPRLEEEIATGKSAHKSFTSAVSRLNACTSVSATNQQGQHIVASIGQLSFPMSGRRSAAYAETFSVQGVNASQDIVIIDTGSDIVGVSLGDVGTVDTGLLQGFVTEAVNKVEGKPTTTPTTF